MQMVKINMIESLLGYTFVFSHLGIDTCADILAAILP